MLKIKRIIAIILSACLMCSVACAEEKSKTVFDSVGGWFDQAWKDSSDWVGQAWDDSSKWVGQAWDDSTKWVGQAWDDSSKWVSQAWNDSTKWVGKAWEDSSRWASQAWQDSTTWAAKNWSNFVIWLKTITSDNPYSWIRDMVLEEGIIAYDDYVSIRTFLSENPDPFAIRKKCYDTLSVFSLLNEEKDILWDMFSRWAEEHKITAEQVGILAIPFLERLNIKGEEALGEDIDITGPAIAQYIITILEAMNINSHEDAESRIKALRSSLDNLTRPIVIGEQDQNIVITQDHCYIENFTYKDGKYQIFMLVSPKEGNNSDMPLMRGKKNDQLIKQYFQEVESWGTLEKLEINGNLAQARRFNTTIVEKAVFCESLQVWTSKNDYLFFVITDQDWKDDEFKSWLTSVTLSEDGKVSFEADFASDGAFYGFNQAAQKYTINRYFVESKFVVAKTGHGWAAERGNNLIDNIKGFFKREHSTVIGDNNVKNGADRVTTKIINGKETIISLIQTKYYSTAARTVNACFDETGYRYVDAEGNPMTMEVPSNQYEAAVKLMEKRIQNGEVRNVDPSDTEMARKIVRKGSLSYQQAKHLAKAGTIESLMYDSAHACVYATSAMGISALVEFAFSLWNGETMEQAIEHSIYRGLKTGGITFIVSVLSSQLLKTGLNTTLVPASDALVRALGPKGAAAIINAFRPAGSAIYGAAAMKAASRLLRGNIVTAAVSFIVLTSFDIAEIIQGRISWKQLAKNATTNIAGISAGALAYIGGKALVGTAIAPGVGTAVGLILGVVAAWGASEGAKALTDLIAEDDAEEMIKIINEQFAIIAEEYFLTEVEVNRSIENLQGLLTQNMLKEMYQYGNHEAFARQLIELCIDPVVMERQYVSLPTEEEYSTVLTETLKEIYSEIGDADPA
ncbi:hypothetical protein [Aristaeella lactis]|uniref:Uncharacterized protein n=1 Tax=Aristaeella lactis TaxID=3046383 RepID=A0AC61PL59_9FIRM|nr:hypothetical protein [Aristaeella lactis]QUA52201.1 hypothetical protein JYE50_10800 [Aristaeella lactis]SMC58786.1 hypothetical protein SAMN06297397_1581 [Aristaeella lactis]